MPDMLWAPQSQELDKAAAGQPCSFDRHHDLPDVLWASHCQQWQLTAGLQAPTCHWTCLLGLQWQAAGSPGPRRSFVETILWGCLLQKLSQQWQALAAGS